MKISISQSIFSKAPSYKVGVAIISGIDNTKPFDSGKILISDLVKNEIVEWDKIALNFGIDTEKFPQANKNLAKRYNESNKIPKINPVVDIANKLSLESGAPVGLHDLDKVGGDIEIRPGKDGDVHIPLNQTKPELIVDPIVYASENRVLTRNWTWRLSEISKADEKSKSVVLFVDTLSLGYDKTVELTNKTVNEITKHLGGRLLQKGILDKESPELSVNLDKTIHREKKDKIDELLSRGVENIIPGKQELEKVLRSGKKLNIYNGIDPSAVHVHVGNAVPLRKLQAFLELGHNVTFLIGNFTALIGDSSDKTSERPILTADQIAENFKTYKKQAEKILDFSKVRVVHNGDWLSKLTFKDVIQLCQHFSVGDFISRELIRKRLDAGTRVRLDEVLYPVMQGYDSYFMDTDIQLGGTDQTFNMQAGRILQKDLRNKESFVIANGFLEGTDGRKMSKSWGNAIWLDDTPDEMFGKVMSLNDELIVQYFTLGTTLPMEKVNEISERMNSGENPKGVKTELALRIVTELHDAKAAKKAQEDFEKTFQKGEPEFKEKVELKNTLVTTLSSVPSIASVSQAKRLIKDGAAEINGRVETDPNYKLQKDDKIKVGKKIFLIAS